MSPLGIKLVAVSVLAVLFNVLLWRFVRPRVHHVIEGGFQGLLLVLTPYLASALVVGMGWVEESAPGNGGIPGRWEYVWMLGVQVLAGAVLAALGPWLRWFDPSPSLQRATEAIRARRLLERTGDVGAPR